MLLSMLFRGLLSVMLRMHFVALCHDRVMRRLLIRPRLMVLRSLAMMLGRLLMMLGCLDVVFGNFGFPGNCFCPARLGRFFYIPRHAW